MSKLTTLIRRAPKRTSAVLAILAAAIIVPATLFAWGPSRQTYTIQKPADHVTFNSITNNPSQGDERNFVQVREANASNTTYADSISLAAGHQYVVFVYFHNNAASNLNASGVGVARGAYVKAQIPARVNSGSNGTKAVGFVGASNSSPAEVWDDISFKNTTVNDLNLKYVAGSATIHSKGAVNGNTMADTIVTTGAPLGYSSLNGVLNGCEQFAGYVTFRVQADTPNFTMSKEVHKTGTTGWKKTDAVAAGDSVDFLISYKNTSTSRQANVVVKDKLPAGLTYTNGTTFVTNGTNPNGLKVGDNVTTSAGINIGNYAAGAAAYVKFSATVSASESSLVCGVNTFRDVATVETDNGSKTDSATVTVTKKCQPKECKPGIPEGDSRCKNIPTPPELPQTGVGENIAAFLGLGALVTSIGYYRASRRQS